MSTSNFGTVRACGVLVFRDADDGERRFLLMKHADRWDLPKGHVDPGETDMETALRELWEETGIGQHDIQMDEGFRFQHQYPVYSKRHPERPPKDKTLVVFLGQLVQEVEIKLTEHIGYEWFTWDPPHTIQLQTVDPLLASLEEHWSK